MHDEHESIHDEEDSSEEENVIEIETYEVNREQNNVQENKLLTTTFEVKVENGKVENSKPIQLINRYSISSLNLEVAKTFGEFLLIFNQFTVNGQHNRKSQCDDEGKSQHTIL